GTPDTESLLSYFYRLAVSHCVSAHSLMGRVSADMGWDKRVDSNLQMREFNVNASGEVAQRWSAALSQLTSVAGLHNLTMLPWRSVVA
ncbi:TniQ family protein, partial [Chryseobacterium sp. SIMBA_029]|uniref:TniQ family protein n=1 Tax=Chryseobacterium sp. SIMBA_029 TaxID=3085772 RepID=UPI003978A674